MKAVALILLFLCSGLVHADAKKVSKKEHLKVQKKAKSYSYNFSGSSIGKALQHLLSNSSGAIYNGKVTDYKKHLKVIKSNPSASFLELRLFYAHLEDADRSEKKFVVHTIKQLNYTAGKEFLSSINSEKMKKNI